MEKRIRVFPDRDVNATEFELSVIDTPVFQRLRWIRQLGWSMQAFPTAEHSRFSHALGTLYWCKKIFSALGENHFAADNRQRLKEAEAFYQKRDGLEYWQLVRLIALLHDVTHIPFGHTLEDQTGLLPRHDEDEGRIARVFAQLKNQSKHKSYLQEDRHAVLEKYLSAVQKSFSVPRTLKKVTEGQELSELPGEEFKYLVLAYDIVGNTICADLFDYTQRDSLMSSIPREFDKSVLWYLTIVPESLKAAGKAQGDVEMLRLGVTAERKKLRHDVITSIISLLRARYDLAEKVYYHHAKCAADAMLEKAVFSANLNASEIDQLTEMGDERFLEFMLQKLQSGELPQGAVYPAKYMLDLKARHLFKAVFRITKRQNVGPINPCYKAQGRREAEQKIAALCRNLVSPNEIIVSCLPETMQMKEALAKIRWIDQSVQTLQQLARKEKYATEASSLEERYLQLWNLTVFIAPEKYHYTPVVMQACLEHFDCPNDRSLQRALEQDRRIRWDIVDSLEKLGAEGQRRALQYVASGERKDTGMAVAIEALNTVVQEAVEKSSGTSTDSEPPLFEKDKPAKDTKKR